ncbi:nxpe family member 3 [Plakobranchus ocellatus]|uniref:Nxpe family member 3 n=1 Tax=Plakobranchus ocellatus TaxID=259542 RepID=A0AAV4AQK5_9GAST|nr:nxpe family member 3 [Plakobranchus ocellatus]
MKAIINTRPIHVDDHGGGGGVCGVWSTVCLPKRQLFLAILALTLTACLFCISFFHIPTISTLKSAQRNDASNTDGENNKKLSFDSLQTESNGSSRTTAEDLLFLKNVRSASGLNGCVTQEELSLKFQRCNQASEKRDSRCKAVHATPDSYWRSQPSGETRTHDGDFQRMEVASECCAFNYPNLLANSPRDPPTPWETDYLCKTPALATLADTAYASNSLVRLVGREGAAQEGKSADDFSVGDQIVLEVVVRNGRNEIQRLGGDSVRIWLVNPKLGASVVADVTDLKNGSYCARSVLPWGGEVKVKATIAHTRHLFRTVMYIQRYFTASHWFTALWEKGVYTEATPCSPYPALPAFAADEICNLTNRNGGFPWYCGKPMKKDLSCSDYISARKMDSPSFFPLTSAEEELIYLTESKRPFLIPSDITLEVKSKPDTTESTIPLPNLPCNQRDLTQTFQETEQSGYLYNNTWRPFACRLPDVNANFLQQCLKDTQLLYLGDSNSRLQMDILTPLVECRNIIARSKRNWHAPLRCDREELNISIKYFPPMHPFYGSLGEQIKPEVLSSAVEKMDAIPARGKYIVHLHNFLHFMPFHLGLVEHRLRLLRAAVERLLARNPHVFVIYQSAHSAYDHGEKNWHKLNAFLVELQRQIMSGLGPRAMFVRAFSLTVANENKDGHPQISNQFMWLYMGHICGRE